MFALKPFDWIRFDFGVGQGATWLTLGPVELQFSWWGAN